MFHPAGFGHHGLGLPYVPFHSEFGGFPAAPPNDQDMDVDAEMDMDPMQEIHNFMRGARGRGGRFGFRGRGGFRHPMHPYFQTHPDSSALIGHLNQNIETSGTSSDSEEEKEAPVRGHRGHKRRHRGSKDSHLSNSQFKEEQRLKKLVVVTEPRAFYPEKVGEYVKVEIAVENQSNRNVPKHTYL
jgi:hypothetical protein